MNTKQFQRQKFNKAIRKSVSNEDKLWYKLIETIIEYPNFLTYLKYTN